MKHHPIFEEFSICDSVGTGQHMFDFLGVKTNVAFKKGWDRFATAKAAKLTGRYPVVNEHYLDWIALLTCIHESEGIFRMAELGAGWAPWLVRAELASRQNPKITETRLVGVEADPTHYKWACQHFHENYVALKDHHLLQGAVSSKNEILRFPRLEDPTQDYGASILPGSRPGDLIEVQGYTLEYILGLFDDVIDFVHSDIQGAEYDILPAHMDLLNEKVKRIMIGTHRSDELHDELKDLFLRNNWHCELEFPRNTLVDIGYGDVQFHDGFLFFVNPAWM